MSASQPSTFRDAERSLYLSDLIAEVRRRNAESDASARAELAAHGGVIRNTARGCVSLTKSTRRGVEWQITTWDADGEPLGHIESNDLDSALKTLRELEVHS